MEVRAMSDKLWEDMTPEQKAFNKERIRRQRVLKTEIDMEEEKKNPPQSTVPNQEVETVVTQTESNVSKAENPNLNLIGLEQPNKPDLFGRRETEDDDLIGLVNPDSIDRPIQTSGGIFGTKRDKDR